MYDALFLVNYIGLNPVHFVLSLSGEINLYAGLSGNLRTLELLNQIK